MNQDNYAALYRDFGILEGLSLELDTEAQNLFMGTLSEIEGLCEQLIDRLGGVIPSAVPQLHIDE